MDQSIRERSRAQKQAAIDRLERRISELREYDPSIVGAHAKAFELQSTIERTLATVFGEDSSDYGRLLSNIRLDDPISGKATNAAEALVQATRIRTGRRDRAIAMLVSTANSMREDLELPESGRSEGDAFLDSPSTVHSAPAENANAVFVVHGRDSPAKIEVARLIERASLRTVILHEQANAGRTIIEKFEDHGGEVGFAVVLLTPDDVGGIPSAQLKPRARQNVIAEMGWFAGKLGRNRVCVLKKGDIEVPSDFAGVGYVDMDDRGAWKAELLKELAAAGYAVDWAKAMA
jgi:predicted nucleotide-binding protein